MNIKRYRMTRLTMTTSTSQFSFAEQVRNYLMERGATVIFLEVEPVPASRPRVSRWGTYYGKTYENFRVKCREALRQFQDTVKHMEEPSECLIEVVAKRPKTSKRDYPRGDVDNFAKGPLDSMTSNGFFWNDDDQITALAVIKRYAEPDEPVGINITYVESV